MDDMEARQEDVGDFHENAEICEILHVKTEVLEDGELENDRIVEEVVNLGDCSVIMEEEYQKTAGSSLELQFVTTAQDGCKFMFGDDVDVSHENMVPNLFVQVKQEVLCGDETEDRFEDVEMIPIAQIKEENIDDDEMAEECNNLEMKIAESGHEASEIVHFKTEALEDGEIEDGDVMEELLSQGDVSQGDGSQEVVKEECCEVTEIKEEPHSFVQEENEVTEEIAQLGSELTTVKSELQIAAPVNTSKTSQNSVKTNKMSFRTHRGLGGLEASSDSSSDSSDDEATAINNCSGSESEPEVLPALATLQQQRKKHLIRTNGEISLEDLPPIEKLQVTVGDDVKLVEIGEITNFIGVLVIVSSKPKSPPLDADTILFLEGKQVLGQVFDTFGPVSEPRYSIRFNCEADITELGIKLGTRVFYAPDSPDWTKYVFLTHLMKMRGSDASWEHDNEPPPQYVDYSDDEAEKRSKAKQRGRDEPDEAKEGDNNNEASGAPRQMKRGRRRPGPNSAGRGDGGPDRNNSQNPTPWRPNRPLTSWPPRYDERPPSVRPPRTGSHLFRPPAPNIAPQQPMPVPNVSNPPPPVLLPPPVGHFGFAAVPPPGSWGMPQPWQVPPQYIPPPPHVFAQASFPPPPFPYRFPPPAWR